MNTITVINAKGGCGKSTIAMNLASALALRGCHTLLVDMDPQAQLTQWLDGGDGLSAAGTLTAVLAGSVSLDSVLQPTAFDRLSFVAASEGLEDLGRQITEREDYATLLAGHLAGLGSRFDYLVIDSPNQISPVMENAIYPADAFVVPFESTKAVRSYANFYKLLLRLRPREDYRILHVLCNLTRQRGLYRRVLAAMQEGGIPLAATQIRSCGWLAQVDEHGGSIFHYRPRSKGASDLAALADELLSLFAGDPAAPAPAATTHHDHDQAA